jgi:hypothetical protein
MLVEQLFRNLAEDSRWNAKPLCLGLAALFAFDVYLFSEALLFGASTRDVSIRGAWSMRWRCPAASGRLGAGKGDWMAAAAGVAHGGLLLGHAAAGRRLPAVHGGVGYYVRYFGGDWGRALQLGCSSRPCLLALLVLSGSLRARLRVFVGKHFFSYRYDYREEWLRFTAMLSLGSPQEVGQQVIRGLADMVESPGGSLWTRTAGRASFGRRRAGTCRRSEARAADSPVRAFLRDKRLGGRLDEYRASRALRGGWCCRPGSRPTAECLAGGAADGGRAADRLRRAGPARTRSSSTGRCATC